MRLISAVIVFLLMSMPAPITVTVTPHFSHAPAYVRVTLIINHHPDNREACLVVEGENFFRSSCWQQAEGSPFQTIIEYKDLPAGHYVAQATLLRVGGKEIQTSLENFRILGSGESPEQ